MQWIIDAIKWLFIRDTGYRADFAAVSDQWEKIVQALDSRCDSLGGQVEKIEKKMDLVNDELAVCRLASAKCEQGRAEDRRLIEDLQERLLKLEAN